MKTTQKSILVLAALTVSVGGFALTAQAKARHCTSEECACEQALEQNTVEALEAFLKKYPQSVNNSASACGALAVPPDDGVAAPEGQSHDDSGAPKVPVATPLEG